MNNYRTLFSLRCGRAYRSGLARPRRHSLFPLLLVLCVVGGALSCSGDTTTGPPPQHAATQAYWQLQLNQRAVNLALTAPYDTFRLTATPLTVTGTPLQGVGTPTFLVELNDSTVTVDSTGLVTAHYVVAQTHVIATMTVQGVFLSDTVYIKVTASPPKYALASFSMQPAGNDSAKRALDTRAIPWGVNATDTDNQAICSRTAGECSLQVFYSTMGKGALINETSGQLSFGDTGHVFVMASTWAYGVAMRDSVEFTVGFRLSNTIIITTLGFAAQSRLDMGVGAVVEFRNEVPKQVDVTFDDTTGVDTATCGTGFGLANAPGSGNVQPFGGDSTTYLGIPGLNYTDAIDFACRRFLVPGTYRYHSTLFPSDTNEIVIQDSK